MVRLTASPAEALVDEEIRLTVTGLDYGQKITLTATKVIDDGYKYESYAHYRADDMGTVDLSRDECKGGSFKGVSSMGLFCSLAPSPSNKHPYGRLMIRDVESPLYVKVTVFEGYLFTGDDTHQPFLTQLTLKRWYKSPGVKRVVVREGRIRGSLFIPEGSGPFPAVVDLFGTAGGLLEYRASLLASRGFLTLSLAYFRYDDLPETVLDLELEYLEEAKDYLSAHDKAQLGGIGIVGVSTGGTLAVAAATYIPGYKCCAMINGSVFSNYPTLHYKGRIWHAAFPDMKHVFVESNGVALIRTLDKYFNMPRDSSAMLEFYQSSSTFLFMFSEDDNCMNTAKHKTMIENLMKFSNRNHRIIMNKGAGHLLEPPFSPHGSAISYAKIIGMPENWGGNCHDHSLAQAKAWSDLLMFSKDSLKNTVSKL